MPLSGSLISSFATAGLSSLPGPLGELRAAAYDKGLVTQRDGRVQQIQFRVFWPDGLFGLWWVLDTNHAISGGLEDTVASRPPSLPGVAQRNCNLVIRYKV